ncbi:MAG TPA: HD domain-containing phosphohydrolase, partial [Blastocatellia bacterium]|nr:HD domain-containing phosphohydrolase [Blastocatellia bacterium]
PLSPEQRMDLWRHSIIGEQAMARRNASRHSQLLVRWHHEWWNGRGYPDRLCFEEIPIGARVLHAVEVYCALIANRPYRPAYTRERAVELLRASAGVQCDPVVITELLALLLEAGSPAVESAPATEFSRPEARDHETILSDSTQSSASMQTSESMATPESTSTSLSTLSTESTSTSDSASISLSTESTSTSRSTPRSESPLTSESTLTSESPLTLDWTSPAEPAPAPEGTVASAQTPVPGPAPSPEQTLSKEYWSSTNLQAPDEASPWLAAPAQLTSQLAVESGVSEAAPPRLEPAAMSRSWRSSSCITGSLLGFQVSVIRQVEFRTVAIPFCGRAALVQYLAALGKQVLSNDARPWAALAGRAVLESEPLTDEQVFTVLQDTYIPGARMSNAALREWFGEADAWWMDNLRRQALQDPSIQDQALLLGMQAGEYALSFSKSNTELKRPLTAIFRELAANSRAMPATHPHNRAYNLPSQQFLRDARADLMYLNLPCGQAEFGGASARPAWQDTWLLGHRPGSDDFSQLATLPQSKKAYLEMVDRVLAAAARIRKWAIECRDTGLASARDISDLIKTHRAIQATYSKDLTEVAGGLRNYIMVSDGA